MPDLLARAALAKYGITADQVKLAAVGGDRERYQALAGGVVEGAVVSNEYQPAMPKTLHLLVAGRDAVPNFLRVCLMTSGKVLKERGDDVVKFLAAEIQGLRFALTHKAETVALTQEIIHVKPDDPRPAFVYDDAVAHHAVDAELPIPAEKLNWMQEQMVMAGKLKAVLPLDQISAPEYREKAAKLVGK
jgi:NitT/TauT family transport system substrate-binding protein